MIISKIQLIWAVVLLGIIQPVALGYIAWSVADMRAQSSIVCGDLSGWTFHPDRG